MARTYPEINGLSLAEARHALVLGSIAMRSVRPEYRADLEDRLAAIRDRIRRLETTGQRIAAIQAATGQRQGVL